MFIDENFGNHRKEREKREENILVQILEHKCTFKLIKLSSLDS